MHHARNKTTGSGLASISGPAPPPPPSLRQYHTGVGSLRQPCTICKLVVAQSCQSVSWVWASNLGYQPGPNFIEPLSSRFVCLLYVFHFIALLTVKHRERHANLPAIIVSKWVTQENSERSVRVHHGFVLLRHSFASNNGRQVSMYFSMLNSQQRYEMKNVQ